MHLLQRARRRLTFANVTSAIALFIALGGTSYAALQLPANSVSAREIRTGAVGKSEVRTGGVGSSEVRTGAIRASEIRSDAVREAEIRANAVRGEEIATDAVGAEEIAANAVGSGEIADSAIESADLSAAARTALTEASSVTFRAAVTSTGTLAGGNATSVTRTATGVYAVRLNRDVGACQFAATLAAVRTNPTTVEQPPVGVLTASPGTPNTDVVVRGFTPAGAALDAPFHLLVAC